MCPLPGCCRSRWVHQCSSPLGECPRRGHWRVSRVRDRARLKGRDSRVTTLYSTFLWARGVPYRGTRTNKVEQFSHSVYFERSNNRVFSNAASQCVFEERWKRAERGRVAAECGGDALPRPLRPSRDYLRHQVSRVTSRTLPTYITKHEWAITHFCSQSEWIKHIWIT